jgi:hypothetical protein
MRAHNPAAASATAPAATPAKAGHGESAPLDAGTAPATKAAAEDAEYQNFLVFQNVGAENSRRASGGRRGTPLS